MHFVYIFIKEVPNSLCRKEKKKTSPIAAIKHQQLTKIVVCICEIIPLPFNREFLNNK